ncbi:hypothetical protein NN3_20220 [Nocardia neocaledoniensis NBRC 108232]|uniref:Uncharacterized protein n=1 Tax=Nocardia neocaledoniensis TaxID=236511 RepID=A0A317N1L1_9NOCA|nr:hypothetical protein DFR69_11979 [Nocardia neocaledoniensis]GEM31015.1 hypothetical protein NN3_20220 [Nocardia neocaledoniensis NBRC 108232]
MRGDHSTRLPVRAVVNRRLVRFDEALQQKLNAIAEGLHSIMGELAADYQGLTDEREELADATGLEDRESSD